MPVVKIKVLLVYTVRISDLKTDSLWKSCWIWKLAASELFLIRLGFVLQCMRLVDTRYSQNKKLKLLIGDSRGDSHTQLLGKYYLSWHQKPQLRQASAASSEVSTTPLKSGWNAAAYENHLPSRPYSGSGFARKLPSQNSYSGDWIFLWSGMKSMDSFYKTDLSSVCSFLPFYISVFSEGWALTNTWG